MHGALFYYSLILFDEPSICKCFSDSEYLQSHFQNCGLELSVILPYL